MGRIFLARGLFRSIQIKIHSGRPDTKIKSSTRPVQKNIGQPDKRVKSEPDFDPTRKKKKIWTRAHPSEFLRNIDF